MNFFDLDSTNLSDYLQRQRKFSGTWFFHHIPKTAGSSLAAELSVMAAPYANVFWEQGGSMKESWALREDAVHALEDQLASDPPRSASGHILAHHLDRLLATAPDMRCFTFLRHPVNRVVSEYFYCCSELHPPHESFRESYPTLEAYVDAPIQQNKLARYLLPDLTMSWEDTFKFMKKRYQMVGLQERYQVSFLTLTGMVASMKLPQREERVSQGKHQIGPGLVHEIAQANSIDLAIYSAVENVYERISKAVWEMHKSGDMTGWTG